MVNLSNKSKCSGCSACYNICPQKCISMVADEEGFIYPSIGDGCIDCGLCESVCPFLIGESYDGIPEVYGAKCFDEEVRLKSSSGGLFSLLANNILNDGGKIFGAVFFEDYKSVKHIEASLDKIRTSKYLQSDLGNCFRDVEKALLEREKVVFSGVPCQIAGLKNYLRKDYENLILIDVICHGVPSPELWKRYVENIEQEHQGELSYVNFRYKKNGWQNFGTEIEGEKTHIFISKDVDSYMQIFLRNFCLRPSCYNCKVKETGSGADITLGDFWGVENVEPELDDGKGTSVVIIHTEKGRKLFESITDDIEYKKVDYNAVKQYNPAVYKSVNRPVERDNFFIDMNSMSYDELWKKYSKLPKKSFRQKVLSTSFGRLAKKVVKRIVLSGGQKK